MTLSWMPVHATGAAGDDVVDAAEELADDGAGLELVTADESVEELVDDAPDERLPLPVVDELHPTSSRPAATRAATRATVTK